jgi:acyl-CoA hydrolase
MMAARERGPSPPTTLVDIVFPQDTNHHGTLFGGVGLAHMDKVAFITASRHGRVDFVTASCERVDFDAPARLGDLVEATGRIVRVGRRSLSVEVELVAEAPLSGERRRCGRAVFHMVAVGGLEKSGGVLPPLAPEQGPCDDDGAFRMVELVLPEQTSHYGSLFGGHALAAMAKAAFVSATRRSRASVVLAGAPRVDFVSQIHEGEVLELSSRVVRAGRSSMTVEVELLAETALSGDRRRAGGGVFVMVAVGPDQRPVAIDEPARG